MEFDFSEVVALQADLSHAPRRVAPFVRKAVERTARSVKDDARAIAAGKVGAHGRLYPYSMEYVMKSGGHDIRAEIGPRPGGQGDLAPIFETGNPFSGRKASLEPALEQNRLDFVRGLERALEDGTLP